MHKNTEAPLKAQISQVFSLMITNEHIQLLASNISNSIEGSTTQLNYEEELCGILEQGDFNHQQLHATFTNLLYQRLNNQIDVNKINTWSLFHALLRNMYFTNIGIELMCTGIRRLIILEANNNPVIISDLNRLILSVAIQCNKNEYAYFAQNDELDIVESVKARLCKITDEKESLEELTSTLLLLIMYISPVEIDNIKLFNPTEINKFNNDLSEFIGNTLNQHANEIDLAKEYYNDMDIHDDVSARVSNMYKDNPYPRWTEPLTNINPNKLPLELLTGVSSFPAYQSTPSPVSTILVAGCGTGRHPIQVALNYPWINITAIDISSRSIAYASMMAKHAGIQNIEFKVCNILDLVYWDNEYDMVDCIGVLHHMDDQDAGLDALLSRLRDNGLLRLGLYSKSARKAITRFRENSGIDRTRPSQEDIRKIRRDIIIKHSDEDNQQIIKSDDFYSLSGCRDLLLHEHEIQYTIPLIKDLLARHQLTFLGLGLPHNSLIPTIIKTCGSDAEIHSLENWHKAESDSPYLFAKMYNFFAQKNKISI